MSANRLADLPWDELLTDLRAVAREESRSGWAHPQDLDDVIQEACAKLLDIGPEHVLACLAGDKRQAWLRLVVRNVIRRCKRGEQRARRVTDPQALVGRAAALRWGRHRGAAWPEVDLSRLAPKEREVVVLLRLEVPPEEIAVLLGSDVRDVLRRARWAVLRSREPAGSLLASLGPVGTSLGGLRGGQRRSWIALFDRYRWPDGDIAAELGMSLNALRLARRHGVVACVTAAAADFRDFGPQPPHEATR